MTRFSDILHLLVEADIEFIVVGGVAAVAHGSPRYTRAVDVVYSRNQANLDRLVAALGGHNPGLRDAPPSLSFRFDLATAQAGLNFWLTMDLGWIDLLGELTGVGKYEDLLPHSTFLNLYGAECRVLNLDKLIRTKRAAGRPRKFETIAELELLRDLGRVPHATCMAIEKLIADFASPR